VVAKKTPAKKPEKPKAKKTLKDFAKKVAKEVKKGAGIENGASPPVTSVTDARKPIAEMSDAEVDAALVVPKVIAEPMRPEVGMAKADDNKEYAIDIAIPQTLIPAMRDAWNEVRNHDDAPYDECARTFQETLFAHAMSVINTSAVLSGDTNLARFEQKLAQIKSRNSQ